MSEHTDPGPGTSVPTPLEVLRTLRELVAEIDAGRLEASSTERAHLVGARDALDMVYKI